MLARINTDTVRIRSPGMLSEKSSRPPNLSAHEFAGAGPFPPIRLAAAVAAAREPAVAALLPFARLDRRRRSRLRTGADLCLRPGARRRGVFALHPDRHVRRVALAVRSRRGQDPVRASARA